MNHPFYLLSNASTDVFPENTLTNFKNKLPKDLIFSEEDNGQLELKLLASLRNLGTLRYPLTMYLPYLQDMCTIGWKIIEFFNQAKRKNFTNQCILF